MVVGQSQQGPRRAQAHLEAGAGERLDQPVPRQLRSARFQHQREPAAHDVRCVGVEQRIHELARRARAVSGECGHHLRRISRLARSGMRAAMSSGSVGARAGALRTRAGLPERRSRMAATTGSASVGRWCITDARRLRSGRAARTSRSARAALHHREVGQGVLGGLDEILALPPEPSFERAHIAGAEPASGDETRRLPRAPRLR